jgi:hypothetical protein
MAMMNRTRLLVICLIVLSGCQNGTRPPDVLEETRFVQIYCDLLQESRRSANTAADTVTAAQNAARIFEQDGVSPEAFEATVRWYNSDVRRWQSFLEKVNAEMERREATPKPLP